MYPSLVIITNIEADHLDCYGTLDNIKDAFVGFTERLPFFGAVIACGDDPGVRDILPRIGRTVITYGINENADYMAKDICCSSGKSIFTVVKRGEQLGSVILNLPGMHNVANALAVIAAASETGIPFVSVVSSLSQFQGVRRRFEIVADIKGVTIVDDYAHHPGEIKATLAAARQSGYKRIIAVFQPHLYTRTRDFMDDFVTSLSAADIMYVTDIYKSREESIAGVSSEVITRKLSETGYLQAHYIKNKDDLSHILQAVIAEGDVVIFMGAGDIWKSAVELAEVMRNG
jgi:UDP-N-acetylmuramate--alanine ligase